MSPQMTFDLWTLAAGTALGGSGLAPAPSVPVPEYRNAVVLGNHDGDNLTVSITWAQIGGRALTEAPWSVRLMGCNARELHEPGGPEARDHLTGLLPAGTPVVLLIAHDDNYGGRLDAAVTYLAVDGSPRDLARDLVAHQWAAAWDGRGLQPLPPWPRTVTP